MTQHTDLGILLVVGVVSFWTIFVLILYYISKDDL
jgi:hypothetical protein